MPIFEFVCKKCGNDFEELVMRKDEKICCPKCSSKRVGKKMSTFAHHGGSSDGGHSHSGGSGSCSSCSGGSCSTCH